MNWKLVCRTQHWINRMRNPKTVNLKAPTTSWEEKESIHGTHNAKMAPFATKMERSQRSSAATTSQPTFLLEFQAGKAGVSAMRWNWEASLTSPLESKNEREREHLTWPIRTGYAQHARPSKDDSLTSRLEYSRTVLEYFSVFSKNDMLSRSGYYGDCLLQVKSWDLHPKPLLEICRYKFSKMYNSCTWM